MILSRISPHMLATLPREVFEALDLGPDDSASFMIEAGEVRVVRTPIAAAGEFGVPVDQVRRLIAIALDDPRAPVPAHQAFEQVRGRIDQGR